MPGWVERKSLLESKFKEIGTSGNLVIGESEEQTPSFSGDGMQMAMS
jgi:hypothetical protein